MNKVKTDDLIGKEFKYMSTGPDFYDCYTLCQEMGKRAGFILPDQQSFIDVKLRNSAIQEGKSKWFTKIEKPEPYCIATFNISCYKNFSTHMGFVLEDSNNFIHILKKKRVCIEKLSNFIWTKSLDGFYRFNKK